MSPEITIKISFAREVGEVSTGVTGVTVGGVEILPPEAPREGSVDQIPPPPTLEDALREMGETSAIPPPPPERLLDVETQALAPLDVRDRRWPHRLAPLRESRGGPHPRRGRRPAAPIPIPTGAAGPKPPPCIASSGNTWRPTLPWRTRPTPWATACRITWRRRSGAT